MRCLGSDRRVGGRGGEMITAVKEGVCGGGVGPCMKGSTCFFVSADLESAAFSKHDGVIRV